MSWKQEALTSISKSSSQNKNGFDIIAISFYDKDGIMSTVEKAVKENDKSSLRAKYYRYKEKNRIKTFMEKYNELNGNDGR